MLSENGLRTLVYNSVASFIEFYFIQQNYVLYTISNHKSTTLDTTPLRIEKSLDLFSLS